ncbi:hypothetical protein LTR66_000725 [Elasticomyces elasticus]|nr:hypothetical protein LTR66_000725 [Elasticomyces elasticus]
MSNAKKDTLRREIAAHLDSQFQAPKEDSKLILPKKAKKPHVNPYLDIWAWSNIALEWGGPEATTAQIKHSHAILPILYHHFGCIVPSYDALNVLQQVGKGRKIIDLGSGNGYWTYMLRRFDRELNPQGGKNAMTVIPVDNGLSEWRTIWVDDTVMQDGVEWLEQNKGAEDAMLLLVYPQVSADFTGRAIGAYKGDTIVVAGTQNANGFTAFADETISAWMQREMPSFGKVLQIPLPSFAGKDEALFVFKKTSS